MMDRAGQLLRRLTATLLVVGLSVCCCHAAIMLPALPDGADDGPTACAAGGCCGETAPTDAPDESHEPEPGCANCCLKGSGLDHGRVALPDGDLLVAAWPGLDVRVPLPTAMTAAPTRVQSERPPIASNTLLHLRCALLV